MGYKTVSILLFSVVLVLGGWSSSAQGICVNVRKANLRMGPSAKRDKSWEVARYMPFKQLKNTGTWVQVQDLDGDIHWIHSKLVTHKFFCAVIKVRRANLRTGPGASYPIHAKYPKAEKYESFRVIKQSKGWSQLTDDYGDKFWVHRGLIWVH